MGLQQSRRGFAQIHDPKGRVRQKDKQEKTERTEEKSNLKPSHVKCCVHRPVPALPARFNTCGACRTARLSVLSVCSCESFLSYANHWRPGRRFAAESSAWI